MAITSSESPSCCLKTENVVQPQVQTQKIFNLQWHTEKLLKQIFWRSTNWLNHLISTLKYFTFILASCDFSWQPKVHTCRAKPWQSLIQSSRSRFSYIIQLAGNESKILKGQIKFRHWRPLPKRSGCAESISVTELERAGRLKMCGSRG